MEEKFLVNVFFVINFELKTPSVEMACILGIQNEIQAVFYLSRSLIKENDFLEY